MRTQLVFAHLDHPPKMSIAQFPQTFTKSHIWLSRNYQWCVNHIIFGSIDIQTAKYHPVPNTRLNFCFNTPADSALQKSSKGNAKELNEIIAFPPIYNSFLKKNSIYFSEERYSAYKIFDCFASQNKENGILFIKMLYLPSGFRGRGGWWWRKQPVSTPTWIYIIKNVLAAQIENKADRNNFY